ncbi:hypothetical protein EV13_2932 [Prochlorococcus sp. MIT 0702]|nr:hypothetical protein EV12_2878 [Prochlorococcus sp. MIT 0701]KGG26151.1 hypothetical protein EV13_2932 [Prochlorococcus sp. MIT 0702]
MPFSLSSGDSSLEATPLKPSDQPCCFQNVRNIRLRPTVLITTTRYYCDDLVELKGLKHNKIVNHAIVISNHH